MSHEDIWGRAFKVAKTAGTKALMQEHALSMWGQCGWSRGNRIGGR